MDTPSPSQLRNARDQFDALLSRKTRESEWQTIFAQQPYVLSLSLPLRVDLRDIEPLGRLRVTEPDFLCYPRHISPIPFYGVIELKRPGVRLPIEAEWEYAARGPDGHIYPWRNESPDDTLANFEYNEGRHTKEVGSYAVGTSWVGALDMVGNAWEWVNDWYAADTCAASPAENMTGPDTGQRKLLCGGSWFEY